MQLCIAKEEILTAARQRGYRFKQKLALPNGRNRIQLRCQDNREVYDIMIDRLMPIQGVEVEAEGPGVNGIVERRG